MKVFDQHLDAQFAAYNVDCVEFAAEMPDNSVDFSVYSPPFSSLYIYSESERDMGNVDGDDAFQNAYRHIVQHLHRVTKPGRLSAIHVKDLVYYSNGSEKGDRGLRDFSGDCIRTHVEAGWSFHSRVTIWRCPVREMTKSKPDGLLYKNFRTDAARIRVGMPEYILLFRKWGDGMDDLPAITHNPNYWQDWAGEGSQFVGTHQSLDSETQKYNEALDIWQKWASPIWMDTNQTDVLNVSASKDGEAERHLCPMPLDLTDRCVRMWSNEGETVFSPFMGIGSEGYASIRAGRRFIGTELKPSYYKNAVKNLIAAQTAFSGGDLLNAIG